MTLWLARDDFLSQFEGRAHGHPLNYEVTLFVPIGDFARSVPVEPAETPDDEDFPGPVKRWYGVKGERFFLFTWYENPPYFESQVRIHNERIRREPWETPRPYEWEALMFLRDLPEGLLRWVSWIPHDRTKGAPYELKVMNPLEEVQTVYAADTMLEVEKLAALLSSVPSAVAYAQHRGGAA